MLGKVLKKLSIVICIAFSGTSFLSCTNENNNETPSSKELLEYSIFFGISTKVQKAVENPNDVVTKYIENRFNIHVNRVIQPNDQISAKERLNMFIAANDIPDVLVAAKDIADYAVSTGKFADLTDYIKDMQNFNKYFPENMWYRFTNNDKKYQIPVVKINPSDDSYKDNPYCLPYLHSLWVREDVLKKLGYKFTPLDDIAKQYMDKGKIAPLESYYIDPPIDTPYKFLDFLRKVKELNIKEGNKEVVPFSSINWSTFHLGSMFDYGHWRIDKNGNIEGFLGTPEAKEWMKMLWTMYREKLIDKNFLLQSAEELQKKIEQGKVSSGMIIPDFNRAVNSMSKVDLNYKIRFIPLPKKNKDLGFYDIAQPGFYRYLIRKDFKDIKRLIEYFDWFYSDEGLDILTWGPENAGLWEIKDGKKQFKNKELAESLINGTNGREESPEKYGLWAPVGNSSELTFFTSKAAVCAPVLADFNPFDSRKNYDMKIDKYMANRQIALGGYDTKGIASYGDGGMNTSITSTYFWAEFQNVGIAKILSAKDEKEFETAWKEQFDLFINKGRYYKAREDMIKWFNRYGRIY
ncbi:hypothetical protein M2651_02510 [Clostridium sp. SYSU_GA19001]|uniref:hypothetical protein n=1 Tax=Clostridium caldaquaticum TaxID=2940653 RepID=UPI002076E819|nr:hypothetical protein [Clostridium caldaquaticum]MCM8709895.1 hypothetical protein [Clostridium caldaquaticum]